MEMPLEVVKEVPTVLWALYPDYLTSWDKENNAHADGLVEAFREMLPYFRVRLTNSVFTKELLEARAPGYTFEVCYLGSTQGESRKPPQRNGAASGQPVSCGSIAGPPIRI